MKTFTRTFLISLMWGELQMRMKALWSFDCRVQMGINRVVNTSTLVQKCRFMGKNKVEGGLNTEKDMNFKTSPLSVWKKELPDAWEVSAVPFYSVIGGGRAAASGHSYTSGSRESYSLRHILSLMYLALSSGSGYRKAILLAYRYSVTWKIIRLLYGSEY